MAWTYDNQDWARFNNGRIELKNADGSWSAAGTPEHSESAGYVTTAANSPEVDKLVAYARAGGTLNPEQQAFMANPLLGMDSFGQSGRWGGSQNLFDNSFDPQQSGALQQSGLSSYVPQQYLASGQQFNFDQSPAQQSARDDSGGLFGNPILDTIGQAAAAYFGGPIGAGLYGTVASGGDIGKGLLAAGMTYAGGQLTGTGSGATGGSWYSPSGDIGNIFSGSGVGTIADVGTGVGSINPSLTESFNSMYSPSAWASTAGAAAGSVAPAGWTQSAWDGLMSGDYSAVTGANAGSGAMPDFTSMIGPGGDVNSAIDAIQQYAAQNPGFDPMQAMQQVNNAASGGEWTNFLNTGAIGDPSTAMSMMQRLQSMGLSPTSALKAVQSAMSGGDSIAGRMLSGGLGAIGGALTGNAAVDAAKIKAQSDLATAQLAADQAKFKPYGMTTFAGQSNFIKDAQGNVIGAGYTAAPWAKSQQDALLGMSVDALDQYRAAPGMFAPMGTAGQRAMSLGNQYLATDPQAQAQKYMNDQQALLATGRERDMNQMLTGEFNRGTYGLGVGATSTGMGAANPRMEAMLNAQRQQDLGLAAQATQGGMDYAKFGTGMVGLGGDLTKGMLAGQTAAFDPYKTALGGASTIEGLAQQPLTLGADLGKANMNTGAASLLMQGGLSANQANQQAGSFSPWGNLLSGAANQVSNYQNQQQQQQQNQQLMNALAWGK